MKIWGMLLVCVVATFAHSDEKPVSLQDYVTGLAVEKGFYSFYYRNSDGKLYLLVQKPQLEQAFLFQSSLPYGVGSNDIGLDRGQLGQTRLVQFERFGKQLLLKQLNTEYRASSSNQAEVSAVEEAFASSVIAGLEIVSESEDALLVDYTSFLLSDIHYISERLNTRKQGSYKIDLIRSGVYPSRSKAFPDNTELESLVTFVGKDAGNFVQQVTPSPESISVHLHHSLIRLPDDQYQTRTFHPMSGYWSIDHKDYATAIDEPLVRRVIPRHRLEKKDPSAAVSEAVEPIVYYLDPGVPEPVRSALIDGALWWDQAFQAIGFKNAFKVRSLPPDADPMDVRYNTIQWVHRATRGWSYGMSVIDPRTGEILKGHVTLGSLRVRQDLLIALGLTSPFNGEYDISMQKEMALARIKQLSAHEIGHTLGIAHNFAASENGRASVMDYPHPLLALKNGKVDLSGAYDTGIGAWDKHAVAYGYQQYSSKQAERIGLQNQIETALQQGLDYVSDPDARNINSANQQGHLWDNGADPVNELNKLMAIRKTALEKFGLNSIREGTPLSQLEENLVPIYLLHRYQVQAVARQIGGVSYRYESKGESPITQGVQAVTTANQKRALAALLELIKEQNLLLDNDLLKLVTPQAYGYQRTREAFKGQTGPLFDSVGAAESLANYIIKTLLDPARLNRLSVQNHNGFDLPTLINQVLKTSVLSGNWDSDIQQRVNLVVIDTLVGLVEKAELGVESRALVLMALDQTKDGLASQPHPSQRLLHSWLEHYFNQGEWKGQLNTAPLPPGSPI